MVRDLFYHFRGTNLVPTLDKMVGDIIANGFWANHRQTQFALDCQNEQDAIYHNGVRIVWDPALPEKPK